MKKRTEADRVIDALGGTFAVAAICDVRPPSVSEWRTRGIPKARKQFLQLRNPEAFQGLRKRSGAAAQ